MNNLIYPTLNLFIYDLRDGLGENTEDFTKNQEYFQRRLPGRSHPLLKLRDAIEGEYVDLLGNGGRETFASSTTQYSLKGWYYPVRLADNYGLLLDCSVEHSLRHPELAKQQAIPVSCFTDLKAELEKRLANTPSTIGQVWMLSGQLSNFTQDNVEAIAHECSKIAALNIDWDLDFRGKTQFLGGMLFEFWHYRLQMPTQLSDVMHIQDIQENHCVFIAIYPDATTAIKASKYNFDWMRLFAYRSKIIWAYGQSQYLKKKLRSDFVTIQQYQKNFNKSKSGKLDLKELRQILVDAQDTLWHYSVNLNYLATQKRTIVVNLLNYERRLERIKQNLTDLQSPSDLKLFHKFIEHVKRRYLEQVESDYESLNIGLTLLTDLINSIRGVIEIERSERDRIFQKNVAIYGVALAAASLAVSMAGQFPEVTNPKDAANHTIGAILCKLGVTKPWISTSVLFTVGLGTTILVVLAMAFGIKVFELLRK